MSERPIYRLDHGSVLPEHRALPIPLRSRNKNSDFGKLFFDAPNPGRCPGLSPCAPLGHKTIHRPAAPKGHHEVAQGIVKRRPGDADAGSSTPEMPAINSPKPAKGKTSMRRFPRRWIPPLQGGNAF